MSETTVPRKQTLRELVRLDPQGPLLDLSEKSSRVVGLTIAEQFRVEIIDKRFGANCVECDAETAEMLVAIAHLLDIVGLEGETVPQEEQGAGDRAPVAARGDERERGAGDHQARAASGAAA